MPGVICNIVVKAHFGRSSFQMKCSPRSDITPHNLSDEVTKIRCEFKFEIRYPDQLSDIPPNNFSNDVIKITYE